MRFGFAFRDDLDGNGDFAAGAGKFHGIGKQVVKDFFEFFLVKTEVERLHVAVKLQVDFLLFRDGLKHRSKEQALIILQQDPTLHHRNGIDLREIASFYKRNPNLLRTSLSLEALAIAKLRDYFK